MKHLNGWILTAGALLCCATVWAQGSYVLTNGNESAAATTATFTNSLGTATRDGTMIVFEGRLDAEIEVIAQTNGVGGDKLASLQLLTQIKLFDELPAAGEVGNDAQGAVAALRSETDSTSGTLYAWGSTNAVDMEWVPLYQTNGITQFSVTDGSTNYITLVFNYTDGKYQVFFGPEQATQTASAAVPSSTMGNKNERISGVSLIGAGGLQSFASASGPVAPLSASIGFSVYATANGILFILDTVNEQGSDKPFIVKALIDGRWVEVGRVQSNPDNQGHYEFFAAPPGLLQVNQSYKFQVIDELGNPHELDDLVTIKTIKMESVVMEPGVLVVTFNTEADRSYQVISAESLTASEWTPTFIYIPVAEGVDPIYTSEPFKANGTTTTVRIPRSTDKSKAFFKIRKAN